MSTHVAETSAVNASHSESFIRLLTKYQQRVFSFILTLVPNWADAEEVLQNTNMVLWRKFEDFQPDTDFVRWANQVAYFEILKFRRSREQNTLLFSENVLEDVASDATNMLDVLETQRDRLADCMKKLTDTDRDLVQLRYQRDCSPQDLATRLGRPLAAVYKSLQRVRRVLLTCMRRSIAAEEHA